jgi:glutathione S-transferase
MSEISSFVLYWRPGTASMAPHAALAEIGVDYRLVEIGREEAQEDPEYRALNPLGVVPTLLDEEQGLVLTESAAILLYLGDRFPESRLAPSDRADYYRWLVFLTNTVQTAMLRFFYPERYGGGDAVTAAAGRDAEEAFDILDRALADRTWLVAEHRTGADLFLFMVTRWGRRLELPAWDKPNLRRHFLAALELPGVQRMLDEQRLELPDWA